MSRPRVVLLECYSSHGECLEFQIDVLKRTGSSVEVWTHPAHRETQRFSADVRHLVLEPPCAISAARRLWLSPPGLLIINTTTGPAVRNLLWLIHPLRLATLGVFHDVDKLRSFSARAMARMIDARVMLAEHLSRAATAEVGAIFDHAHFLSNTRRAVPDVDPVLIAIPGAFSHDKKDISALLELASDARLDPRVRFVLLGRFSSAPEVTAWWNRCVERGIEHRFVRFTGFVPQPVFDDYLRRCLAVLPLIQPSCEHYRRFRTDKVSGAVNLALGLGLPLLIHEDLAEWWRFGPAVSTYRDSEELLAVINTWSGDEDGFRRHLAQIAAAQESNVGHQRSLYLKACIRALRGARNGGEHCRR